MTSHPQQTGSQISLTKCGTGFYDLSIVLVHDSETGRLECERIAVDLASMREIVNAKKIRLIDLDHLCLATDLEGKDSPRTLNPLWLDGFDKALYIIYAIECNDLLWLIYRLARWQQESKAINIIIYSHDADLDVSLLRRCVTVVQLRDQVAGMVVHWLRENASACERFWNRTPKNESAQSVPIIANTSNRK